MAKKMTLYDFVYGDCWMQRGSAEFVSIWLKTKGNPCSVCPKDKPKCGLFKQLVAMDVLGAEENTP